MTPNRPEAVTITLDDERGRCRAFCRPYNEQGMIATAGPDANFCIGYVVALQGFASQNVCFPEQGTNVVILMRVITAFGRAHPEKLDQPMETFAAAAVQAAYPCN